MLVVKTVLFINRTLSTIFKIGAYVILVHGVWSKLISDNVMCVHLFARLCTSTRIKRVLAEISAAALWQVRKLTLPHGFLHEPDELPR